MKPRHFLKLSDFSGTEIRALIARASELRKQKALSHRPLLGKTLAMIFAKNSTRTRVSFEVAMAQFGGHALFLSDQTLQLKRNEPLADTAKVISRMCDAVMIRNDSQGDQEEFAKHSRVPVINGLSDRHHPCQLLADLQTWAEHHGDFKNKTAAWIGDGNNVCHSWIEAARLLGFRLRVVTPKGYEPDATLIREAGDAVEVMRGPVFAANGADLIVTDTWTSMGQEKETQKRLAAFAGYQVNAELMARAKPDAIFMHCLPAHRGEEVSAEVIDGPQSVVWDEAENRLHAQKALLENLLSP